MLKVLLLPLTHSHFLTCYQVIPMECVQYNKIYISNTCISCKTKCQHDVQCLVGLTLSTQFFMILNVYRCIVLIKPSFYLLVTVVTKSFSTVGYILDLPFLWWPVFKPITLSVDRRTYSLTSVTLIYSLHSRLNGNWA